MGIFFFFSFSQVLEEREEKREERMRGREGGR